MPPPVQTPGLHCLGVEQRTHASCGFPARRSLWGKQLPCVFLHPKKSSSNSEIGKTTAERERKTRMRKRRWNKGDGCLAGANGLGRGRQDVGGTPQLFSASALGSLSTLLCLQAQRDFPPKYTHWAYPGKHATFHSSGSVDSHQEALLSRAQCIVAIGWKQQCKSDLENICSSSLHLPPAPLSNLGSDQLE